MKEDTNNSRFLKKFKNPPSKYRGAPFWSWNTKLEKELVKTQIQTFSEMGMGGFHIHVRTGLKTPYLSPEFMNYVRLSINEAKKKELTVWLYDEDRWPSGFAGGKVTENTDFRCRYLLITRYKKNTKQYTVNYDSCAPTRPHGHGEFLIAYRIKFTDKGYLKSYASCEEESLATADEEIWYVYQETAENNPWFNGQSYVDTLNPDAIDEFIHLTHESYAKQFSDDFGTTIGGIFTDEPQFARKKSFGKKSRITDIMLPYTKALPEAFKEKYHIDILSIIPELIWDYPENTMFSNRYYYHRFISERFNQSYSEKVGNWCRKNNIALLGHMMEEPTLDSQTRAIGEVMSSLRYFDIPGIDMLCDNREFTTAKQAQSIVHQYEKKGMVAELYGVTNWDFDFRNHKLQGDWMAALGVSLRVHHLSWMSMGGESKRDFPASIGFQSPWYKQYSVIEDHFARINCALEKGTPIVKIGVIHPVESYWSLFNTSGQNLDRRVEIDENFQFLCNFLLKNLLDFDYIAESLIPELENNGMLGKMSYDVILVPGCHTIRNSTFEYIKKLKGKTKDVIFIGQIPSFINAESSDSVKEYVKNNDYCRYIPFEKSMILDSLEPYRQIDIKYLGEKTLKKPNHKKEWTGKRNTGFVYQLRQENQNLWLFVARAEKNENPDLVDGDHLEFFINGNWNAEEYDTISGNIFNIPTRHKQGKTYIEKSLFEHDSLLLCLSPTEISAENIIPETKGYSTEILSEKNLFDVPVNLVPEEKNVLVLDLARFSLDGNPFLEKEEILKIDEILRKSLGYPPRQTARIQPWVITENQSGSKHNLQLQFGIFLENKIDEVSLALENYNQIEISINDTKIEKKMLGHYIDPAIEIISLPSLPEGKNIITLSFEYDDSTELEPCYLLGDFLVDIQGANSRVSGYTNKNSCWGDIVTQGYPFYGGNISYNFLYTMEKGNYEIEISKYRGALLELSINGEMTGRIIFSPYNLKFQIKEAGEYEFSIKVYGNRFNTFGALHDCDENEIYFDPSAWRTSGQSWSYEYQFKKTGILKSPVIRKIE